MANPFMAPLDSKPWRGLGHLFRLKTIGDILGWWTTDAWAKAVAMVIASIGTGYSYLIHAPLWTLPLQLMALAFGVLWMVKTVSLRLRSGSEAPAKGVLSIPRAEKFMDFGEFSAYKPVLLDAPFGTQHPSVLSVKNNYPSPLDPIFNVRRSIEYHFERKHKFTVSPVLWFAESPIGYYWRQKDVVDIAWGGAERFPIFMIGDENEPPLPRRDELLPITAMWFDSKGNETARLLDRGLWTAKIRVTADNHEAICAEVDFTVHPQIGKRLLTITSAPESTRLRIECSR